MEPVAEAVVCLVSAPTERASEIAGALVAGRLAACVSIVPRVESIYWWEGEIQRAAESLLVIKTTRAAVDALIAAIRAAHPYEVFEFLALDVAVGNPDYLRWIAASVS